ncbi:MAG: hypothetical protein DDT18_01893 [Actinobacteria bacterium]|nr:hypothetical protein [Actinomycetota bacterium]
MDGIYYGRSCGGHGYFSHPFGAVRSLGMAVLYNDGLNLRSLPNGGDMALGKGIGDDPALLQSEFLSESIAQAHHHPSFHLPFYVPGMDSLSDIVSSNYFEDFNFPGLLIYFHNSSLGPKAVGEVDAISLGAYTGIPVCPFRQGIGPGGKIVMVSPEDLTFLSGQSSQLRQTYEISAVPFIHNSVPSNTNSLGIDIELLGSKGEDSLLEFLAGRQNGVSRDKGLTRSGSNS